MMGWNGPILTDSGGFQVFSLGGLREVTDDGVRFASHIDGTPLVLSPESVVEAQERLGSDISMPLDECVGPDASYREAEVALDRTQRWWRRSRAAHTRPDQALFVLVQGGLYADLRRQAARAASSDDAPGFAIGGFSIGEPKAVTADLLAITTSELAADRPRYLMGVGHPADLVRYAHLGVDLFDCVLPTRLGRNGSVWTDEQGSRLDLSRRAALNQPGPIMHNCTCRACAEWSVSSLASLFQARDPLAYRLASLHNLTLLSRIARELREKVLYTANNPPSCCRDLAIGDHQ
jgi:queuine tRNA-ribosyltransferase